MCKFGLLGMLCICPYAKLPRPIDQLPLAPLHLAGRLGEFCCQHTLRQQGSSRDLQALPGHLASLTGHAHGHTLTVSGIVLAQAWAAACRLPTHPASSTQLCWRLPVLDAGWHLALACLSAHGQATALPSLCIKQHPARQPQEVLCSIVSSC